VLSTPDRRIRAASRQAEHEGPGTQIIQFWRLLCCTLSLGLPDGADYFMCASRRILLAD
jgi:hypothetical protein